MAYEMTQLDYVSANEILKSEDDPKSRLALLEAMDKSDWRMHPVYGCVHKDVFQTMDVFAEVEQPTRFDSEMVEPILDTWKEGRKEQTFQTHDAS